MKKRPRVLVISIGFILISLFFSISSIEEESFLKNVEGEIYYLKRDEGILKLYRSQANLKNEELIYSHYKKGKINNDNYNDNITDFRYYPDTEIVEFEAMNGEWSIFRIKVGDEKAECIKTRVEDSEVEKYAEVSIDVDYIDLENDEFSIYEKDGSIYLNKGNTEKCIKKYWGIAQSDISGLVGYVPEGLSPDSKYLIYGTTGSFTGIGALLGTNKYKRYNMDLDTLESVEYINSQSIQWVNE